MVLQSWESNETDAWVLPQKTFYRTRIHIGHQQLRHLISSPSPHVIYFVDKKKVFCLDTKTNTRILITELLFEVRCTASGHGWFCAGGESLGYFAAMRIPEIYKVENSGDNLADCPQHQTLLEQLDTFYQSLPPQVRIERLGEQIVNSISIHRLQGLCGRDADEIVAIITNNDQTVRIYSLTRDIQIYDEKFDFPMNHATISPDGTLLMIVGDMEIAHFYKTVFKPVNQPNLDWHRSGEATQRSWSLLRQIRLHKPPRHESSAYFTTAWSPTGRFCATASQNGAITLIDTCALGHERSDPILTVIHSSRPGSTHGGVRAMCFAPHPWDLLMWNEHSGRMCVADLRNNLSMRQVVDLDPISGSVSEVKLMEGSLVSAERSVDWSTARPQRRSDMISYIETLNPFSVERRHYLQQVGSSTAGQQTQGLTEEEQQILDGIRTTRQREELQNPATNRQVTPRSIHYSAPRRPSRHYAQNTNVLGSIRNYLQEQNWSAPTNSNERHSNTAVINHAHRFLGATSNNEVAARHHGQSISTRDRTSTSNEHEITTDDDDDDDMTLVPMPNFHDNPSPRTRATLPNPHPASNNLTLDSAGAYRDYRQRVAELDAANSWRARTAQDAALRGRRAEIQAEIEATERQRMANETLILAAETENGSARRRLDAELDAVNVSAARLTATGLAAAEREISDRRRRLLDLASTEVNAERRRRMREATLRTPPISSSSYSSARDSALTTRGEAVLAREQREQQEREAEREEERADPSAISNANAARNTAEHWSVQWSRSLRARGDDSTRRLRVRSAARASASNSNARLGTTGIAWGDASTVYVGIEEGIFELKLDFEHRKFWPALQIR